MKTSTPLRMVSARPVVWISSLANGRSILARRREICVSTTLVFEMNEAPHALEQHRPGDNAALVAHQDLQQAKLARLQIDRRRRGDGAGDQIHLQIGDAQHRLCVLERRAPRERVERASSSEKAKGLTR